jgi:hypothetical protein
MSPLRHVRTVVYEWVDDEPTPVNDNRVVAAKPRCWFRYLLCMATAAAVILAPALCDPQHGPVQHHAVHMLHEHPDAILVTCIHCRTFSLSSVD